MGISLNWVMYDSNSSVGVNPTIVDYLGFTTNSPFPTSSQWSSPVSFGFQSLGSNIGNVSLWLNSVINRNTLTSVSTPPILSAPTAPTFTLTTTGITGHFYYRVTFVTSEGETDLGAVSAQVSAVAQTVHLTIPLGTSDVINRKIYRTIDGGNSTTGPFYLLTTISDNASTTFSDNILDSSLHFAGAIDYTYRANTTLSNYKVKALDYGTFDVFQVDYASSATYPFYENSNGGFDTYDTYASPVSGNFIIDGVTLDTTILRTYNVMLKHESDPSKNGIYNLLCDGAGNYILTTHPLFQIFNYKSDVLIGVSGGLTNSSSKWAMTFAATTNSFSYDPSNINLTDGSTDVRFFSQFLEYFENTLNLNSNVTTDELSDLYTLNFPSRQQGVNINYGATVFLSNQNNSLQNGAYNVVNVDPINHVYSLARDNSAYYSSLCPLKTIIQSGENLGAYRCLYPSCVPQSFYDVDRRLVSAEDALVGGSITPNDLVYNTTLLSWDNTNRLYHYDTTTVSSSFSGVTYFILISSEPYGGVYAQIGSTHVYAQIQPYPQNHIVVRYKYVLSGVYTRNDPSHSFSSGSVTIKNGYSITYLNEKIPDPLGTSGANPFRVSVGKLNYYDAYKHTPSNGDVIAAPSPSIPGFPNAYVLTAPTNTFNYVQWATTATPLIADIKTQYDIYYVDVSSNANKTQFYVPYAFQVLKTDGDYMFDPIAEIRYVRYHANENDTDGSSINNSWLTWVVDTLEFNGTTWYPYFVFSHDSFGFIVNNMMPSDYIYSSYGNSSMINFWSNLPTNSIFAVPSSSFNMNSRQRAYSGRYLFSYQQAVSSNYYISLGASLNNSL